MNKMHIVTAILFISAAVQAQRSRGGTQRKDCGDPLETGVARGGARSESQYYYDNRANTCRRFTYRGSGGNGNRFETAADCERICVDNDENRHSNHRDGSVRKDCDDPRDTGERQSGKTPVTKYYFDTRSNRCLTFRYLGAAGNRNRFASKDTCERICLDGGESTNNGRGSRGRDSNNNGRNNNDRNNNDRNNNDRNNNGRNNNHNNGRNNNNNGWNNNHNNGRNNNNNGWNNNNGRDGSIRKDCDDPRDTGTRQSGKSPVTKYYYDTRTDRCLSFRYLGAEGSRNRFSNKDNCERICLDDDRSTKNGWNNNDRNNNDRNNNERNHNNRNNNRNSRNNNGRDGSERKDCDDPRDTGARQSGKSPITKYYYDTRTNRCLSFRYLGAEGSRNRFANKDNCERICLDGGQSTNTGRDNRDQNNNRWDSNGHDDRWHSHGFDRFRHFFG